MKVRLLICFILSALYSTAQYDTTQKVIPGRINSLEQQQKPYVILISSDGFRYDYAERYNAVHLKKLGSEGVRAESMIPSFPSLTYPNHYSIVTGMYPSHHGLVDNKYYDRNRKDIYTMSNRSIVEDGTRYGGIPLWVLAEQQQMITASFYWVGAEADILGVLPTYYYKYNDKIDIDKRIRIVVDWLSLPEEKRPHFISFYFPEVDYSGHTYGPDGMQTEAAVKFVDRSVKKLTDAVNATGLPVNFIFVSDHGMTNIDTARSINMLSVIDTMRVISNRGSQVLQLYVKDKNDIRHYYKELKNKKDGYKVYLKKDMPRRFHYNPHDDFYNKIGDIILLPDWPRVFTFTGKVQPGAHGFDPVMVKDMHATFYAWGPAFKKRIDIPSFKNIHVFPVIADVLGINYSHSIDGDRKLSRSILK